MERSEGSEPLLLGSQLIPHFRWYVRTSQTSGCQGFQNLHPCYYLSRRHLAETCSCLSNKAALAAAAAPAEAEAEAAAEAEAEAAAEDAEDAAGEAAEDAAEADAEDGERRKPAWP